jgi:hypothetical protein
MAYDIIGNVTDVINGEPVVGAIVVDVLDNNQYTASTTADGNGYYEIQPQNNRLVFKATGYFDKIIDLTSFGNQPINLDVQMDRNTSDSSVLQIVDTKKSAKKYLVGGITALVFIGSTYIYGKKIGMDNKILAMTTLGMGALGYLVGSSGYVLYINKKSEKENA